MWPFNKKSTVSATEDEITLLPEDNMIPEELPPLEIQSIPSKPVMMEKEMPEMKVIPKASLAKSIRIIEPENKFVRMDHFNEIFSNINMADSDFSSISHEIDEVTKMRETRNDKTESLQLSLEDVEKKLMFIENALFGG